MFIAVKLTKSGGKVYRAYVLKDGYWDKKLKRIRQRYIAYLGKSKTIPLAKAKAICKKKGFKLEGLRRVRGLRIK